MRKLEVRFCDGPRELIGWIQVPDHVMVLGSLIQVADDQADARAAAGMPIGFKIVSQPGGFGHNYLALKADGHTRPRVAQLLRGYGFKAAP
jgi:hypothetical protein